MPPVVRSNSAALDTIAVVLTPGGGRVVRQPENLVLRSLATVPQGRLVKFLKRECDADDAVLHRLYADGRITAGSVEGVEVQLADFPRVPCEALLHITSKGRTFVAR